MMLGIEATDRGGSVALERDGVLIDLVHEHSERTHSERIMPLVDDLLKKRDARYTDLQSLAVAIGPGSFTGVRLAVTTAKTLALTGGNLPSVGVTTLRLLAEFARTCGRPVHTAVDARRGELYVQTFSPEGDRVVPRDEPRLVEPDQYHDEIAGGPESILVYRSRDTELNWDPWPSNVHRFPDELARPLGAALIRVARERLNRGESDPPGELAPLYVRSSDAQRSRQEDPTS